MRLWTAVLCALLGVPVGASGQGVGPAAAVPVAMAIDSVRVMVGVDESMSVVLFEDAGIPGMRYRTLSPVNAEVLQTVSTRRGLELAAGVKCPFAGCIPAGIDAGFEVRMYEPEREDTARVLVTSYTRHRTDVPGVVGYEVTVERSEDGWHIAEVRQAFIS